MEQKFNPKEHLMKIGYKDKAQDYLEVRWRLVWFRTECPNGTIETEMIHLDLDRPTQDEQMVWNNEKRRSEKVVKEANGFVIFRAIVKDGKGGMAVGTKSEKAAAFPDYIEKCESGAVGRALAMLGYGTQFTGDELKEGHRIVDSPVDLEPHAETRSEGQQSVQSSSPSNAPLPQKTPPASAKQNEGNRITDQQLTSIRKLCQYLSKDEPFGVDAYTYDMAKDTLKTLTAEYRQKKSAQPIS